MINHIRKLEEKKKRNFYFKEKKIERTVSTSIANILLEDLTGLYEDLICLKFLN